MSRSINQSGCTKNDVVDITSNGKITEIHEESTGGRVVSHFGSRSRVLPSMESNEHPWLIRSNTYSLNLPIDVFGNILEYLNIFDSKGLILASKFTHVIFFKFISSIVAKIPSHLTQITKVLKSLHHHPYAFLQIRTIAVWAFPTESDPYPITSDFFELVSKCKNLIKLAIGKGSKVFTCTTEKFLKLKECKKLEVLELDYCPMDTNALSFLELMPNMRSVRIRGHHGVKDISILDILQRGQMLNSVKKLEKIGFWQDSNSGKICVRDFFAISDLNLTELILSSCVLIGSPEDSYYKSQKQKQLQMPTSPNRHHMKTTSSSSLLKPISSLSLERNAEDENKEAFAVLQNMPLIHLGLFFTEIPDRNFAQLLEVKTLTSLHVGGCWELKNTTLEKLSNLPHLLNLSISRVSTLSEEGIRHISTHPTLSTLRISNCPLITDGDIEPLVAMKSLTRIDLDATVRITDKAIRSTLACLPNIMELVLIALPQITDEGIRILEVQETLKHLLIRRCKAITKQGVENLKQKHPNVWIGNLKIAFEPVLLEVFLPPVVQFQPQDQQLNLVDLDEEHRHQLQVYDDGEIKSQLIELYNIIPTKSNQITNGQKNLELYIDRVLDMVQESQRKYSQMEHSEYERIRLNIQAGGGSGSQGHLPIPLYITQYYQDEKTYYMGIISQMEQMGQKLNEDLQEFHKLICQTKQFHHNVQQFDQHHHQPEELNLDDLSIMMRYHATHMQQNLMDANYLALYDLYNKNQQQILNLIMKINQYLDNHLALFSSLIRRSQPQ